ncbi:hypothetical protein LTR08_008876 [Meristemomyces frigidus]|nr:hypothetical protein LTR08_008876 [Meristemomyces frigidus]
MASAISKRQQARNERALQDLVRSVPGNDRCADCSTKNPGWASWNLGVFLCMRCAGLHRKLGTHVSKVKSLSMDSWTTEQVDSMKKTGNVEGNRRYNPRNVRPDLPIDADEVEPALERYIRQKYEQRVFSTGGAVAAPGRQNTGSTSTGSWTEEPPPLPPKPAKRFGFSLRSASSTLPRQSKQDQNFTPPISPTFSGSDRSGHDSYTSRDIKESNKPSRMFGMKITRVSNNFDAKLATLRDMGFSDTRRNSDVLKSMDGNLDRAIETLVGQGEGSGAAATAQAPGSRALTPVSMASTGFAGLTIDKTRQAEPKANNNPWEIREQSPQRAATQPLPQASAIPRSQSAAPAENTWNPYMGQQSQQLLENSFQNLQVSQTGPAQQQQHHSQPQGYGQQQALYQNNPFQQQQGANAWGGMNASQMPLQPTAQQPYAQQQYQQQAPVQQQYQQQAPAQQVDPSSNPFLRKAASQTFTPSNPWAQSAAPQQGIPSQQPGNPYGAPSSQWAQPTPQQQAAPSQQPGNPYGTPWQQPQQTGFQQQQQTGFQQPTAQSPMPMHGGQTEYFAQPQQTQQTQPPPQQQWPPSQGQTQQNYAVPAPTPNLWQQQQAIISQPTGMPQQQYQQQPPPQPTAPQFPGMPQQQQPQEQSWSYTPKDALPSTQPGRHDKSSILSLYNMGSFAQARPMQSLPEESQAVQPQYQQQYQPQQFQSPPQQVPQRSVTMPVQQAGNPFLMQQPTSMMPQHEVRHVSNESAAFTGMGGDRAHSPDAFSGLSARYVR